jgi:tetratricopeptide (TPR) repeat protein
VEDAYEAEALAEYLVSPDEWSIGADGPHVRAVDPQERNALLQRFLRRAAARRPVVLSLDDAQWGSEALSLVEHLLAEPPIAVGPVLLLLCVRREALRDRPLEARRLDALMQAPGSRRLDVPPLADGPALQLVRDVLGLEPRLAAAVQARAAGRPQFAVQLVGDWVRRGKLRSGPDGFALDGPLEEQLPADLDAIWDERVARLEAEEGSEAAASLEVAAALGLQVDAFEWNHACSEIPLRARPDLIEALVDQGLADATEGGWAFASVLLREALERQARSRHRWRDVHRACATMLSRRYPAGRPGLDERLGAHLVAAGALDEGATVLGRAADELQAMSEHRRAQEVSRRRERALAQAGAPEADRRWGECLLVHANAQLALGHLDGALEVAVRLEDRAHACRWPDLEAAAVLVQGIVDRLHGDIARAELQLREALEVCPAADFATRGRCTSYLAAIRRQRCEFEEALGLYEEARRLYEQGHAPLGEAQSRLGLATVAQELGRIDEAEALYLELAHEFEALGHLFGLAAAYNGLASVAQLRGDLERAESGFRRAWDLLERIGSPAAIATGLNVAFVHILQADSAGVSRALHRIEARGAASAQRPWLGQLLVYRLPGLARGGDWAAFDRCLQNARELLRERAGPPQDIAEVAQIAAEACADRGEPHRARAAFLIAREQWELLDEDECILDVDRRLAALDPV